MRPTQKRKAMKMDRRDRVLAVLRDAHKEVQDELPWELVEDILGFEEDAQFAERRSETISKISERVRAAVDREELEGEAPS